MMLPALLFLSVFIIFPFLMSFRLALTNQSLIPGPIPAKFVALRNFKDILTDTDFWQALWNVVRFTLMVVPLQCGFALLVAFLLDRQKTAKNFFRGVFFLPYITPIVIVCVIWATVLQYPAGVMNTVFQLLSFGLFQPVDWLGTPFTALPSIVMLSAWQAYGFQMIIYLAGLQNINEELYEAAEIDGTNARQKFLYVTWPSLAQTNILVFIITTIQALKLFTQVNILTNGGPRGTTNTIVHYIYEAGFVGQKIGYASAASILLFIFVVGVFLFQRRLLGDTN